MKEKISLTMGERREIWNQRGRRCEICRRKVGDWPNDFAYEIHHKDLDCTNNARSNLQVR
jgi:hypothetical protein